MEIEFDENLCRFKLDFRTWIASFRATIANCQITVAIPPMFHSRLSFLSTVTHFPPSHELGGNPSSKPVVPVFETAQLRRCALSKGDEYRVSLVQDLAGASRIGGLVLRTPADKEICVNKNPPHRNFVDGKQNPTRNIWTVLLHYFVQVREYSFCCGYIRRSKRSSTPFDLYLEREQLTHAQGNSQGEKEKRPIYLSIYCCRTNEKCRLIRTGYMC